MQLITYPNFLQIVTQYSASDCVPNILCLHLRYARFISFTHGEGRNYTKLRFASFSNDTICMSLSTRQLRVQLSNALHLRR